MNRATRLLATGLVWCFTTTSILGVDDTGNKKTDAKSNRPGASFRNLTDEGAWFWYPDPKAVYHEGKHKRTYFGWVTKKASIRVGCYDHETKQTTEATLKEKLKPDSHAVPSLLVRPDGRLIAFYAKHYDKKATLYRVSKEPEDISSWGPEMKVGTDGGYSDFTNAVQLSKEDDAIYLFRRGDNFSTSSDAVHWSSARKLMERMEEKRGHAPYLKVASNGVDTIHLAMVDWGPVDSHGVKSSIYYARYHGGTFFKADGSNITDMKNLPIKRADADKVYDGSSTGFSGWLGDIAIDAAGNPVILYHVYLTYCKDGQTHLRYRYARWDGKRWDNHTITEAVSMRYRGCYPYGGNSLDHADPSIVYLATPVQDVYEIEKWMTPDGGASWSSQSVTSGSTKDNLRPTVPRGYRGGDVGLIWMYGDYMNAEGARYGDYDTVLKFK